nr:EAL domain-containing protein [Sulfurivirga sp.]
MDRAFVSGLPDNPQDADLVRLLKNIVDTFRLESVVEGVENAEQAAFLTALGFRRAQGYLYGRPMDVEAMDAWLEQAPRGD